MNNKIDRSKLPFKLLVEGKDDQYVIGHIREIHRLPDSFEIIDCKGIDKIPDQIVARIKLQKPTIDAIGIVLDADQNLQARWDSVRGILRKEGYEVPESPKREGTIIGGISRKPTVGIWLMPDNLQSGMLEDFVRLLIRPDDLLAPFVEQVLSQIERLTIENRYDPEFHRAKAYIHTWLAWQKEPGKSMGTAIVATYLDQNTELCLRFVNWLNLLFNPQ